MTEHSFMVVVAVAIGILGASVGLERPIVQIGSAIASALGQIIKVTGTRLRTFVACGTAAGIAAAFNAPIAGALFAREIVVKSTCHHPAATVPTTDAWNPRTAA